MCSINGCHHANDAAESKEKEQRGRMTYCRARSGVQSIWHQQSYRSSEESKYNLYIYIY
eukprot:gene10882-7544_t